MVSSIVALYGKSTILGERWLSGYITSWWSYKYIKAFRSIEERLKELYKKQNNGQEIDCSSEEYLGQLCASIDSDDFKEQEWKYSPEEGSGKVFKIKKLSHYLIVSSVHSVKFDLFCVSNICYIQVLVLFDNRLLHSLLPKKKK